MTTWPRPDHEIEFTAIRSQGAGGQNVNKVSSAAQLRFDIRASALPPPVKARLLRLRDHRITAEGVVVIKSQQHRSLDRNRAEALERLRQLVAAASTPPKKRIPTRTPRSQKRRRLDDKVRRGRTKRLRGSVDDQA